MSARYLSLRRSNRFWRTAACLGVALPLWGCFSGEPKTAEDVSYHEEGEVSRLRRENLELEGRLREVQTERDADRAALGRCRGGPAQDVAAQSDPNSSAAGRDLPVVRLVPEPEHLDTPGTAGQPDEGRLVLRASGDGQGEISRAAAEPDTTDVPPESGVRISPPEGSAPPSPSKPHAPAENSTR